MALPSCCCSSPQKHANPPNTGSCERFQSYRDIYVCVFQGCLCAGYLHACLWLGIRLFSFSSVKHWEVLITLLYLHRSWCDRAHKPHINQQDLSVWYPFCWTAARIRTVWWQWDRTLFCKLLNSKFVGGNFFRISPTLRIIYLSK